MTETLAKVDDSQAQFEAWCKTVMSDDSDFCMEWGDYMNLNVRIRWEAWRAARRAIVVDTGYLLGDGDNEDSDYTLGFNQGITKADKAIRAAGITVKGDSDEANANAS